MSIDWRAISEQIYEAQAWVGPWAEREPEDLLL
jgi:hypothetical protein